MAHDETTLKCSVRWSVSRQALAQLTAGGEALRFLRLQSRTEQRADVTITSTAQRIDFPGDTIFGSGIGLVDDGNLVTCVSHADGQALTVERGQIRPAGFESPVLPHAAPWLEHVVLPDGRPGSAVTVDLDELRTGVRYRHRLFVDPHADNGPLDRRLLELLLGDAGLHSTSGYPFEAVAELVTGIGAPAGAAVVVLDENGEPGAEIGRFRIDDLRYVAGPIDLVDGPGSGDVRRDGAMAEDAYEPVVFVEARPFTTSVDVPTGRSPSDAPAPDEDLTPAAPLRRRDDDGDGDGDGGPEEPPDTPPPPPMTTAAVFGLLIRQRLLDELSSDINRVLGPLAGVMFPVVGGAGLSLDWLARARTAVLASRDAQGVPAAGLGTLLFCLAHDVQPPAASREYNGPTATVPGWGTLAGRGLLDREAMHTAKAAMTAGALTPATLARLSPAVAAAVRSAATDWSALTPGQRLELAFAVLLETTGTLTFPLPPSLTFNAAELVVGELTGYTGILTLPPATAAAPGVCPLITSLRCRSSGVDGTVMLGGLGITGTLNRRPGTTFLLVVALSPVVALAIPALAWAVPLVASAGIFLLLDSATASVTLSGISADFRVRFVPDGLSVLKAQVSVGVTAAASVSLSSSVPTGLHQIADLVTSAIASSGRILVDLVGSALGVQLTRIVARTFGRGFPAAFLPVGVPVLSSFVNGQDDSHLYLESQLAAPAGTSLNTIPVRADARESARQDAALIATATPSQRHYISLVSSQNSLNALLAADFVRRRFDAVFDQADRNALRSLAPSPYPTGTPLLMARLRATAPPRLTLRQATPSGTAQHGDLQLDMRLVLGPDKEQRFAWTFRLDAPVQIVVGSAAESTKPKIELLTAYTQPIDVLIDLAGAAVQVSAVQAIQVIRHQITEEITSPTGHPTTISYTLEEEVETTTGLSGPTAAAVQPLALSAVRLGLNWRDIRRAPRRDGVSATGGATGQPDPLTVQTYLLDGTDPDDVNLSTAAAFARADLGFRSGLLFQHISLAGLVVGALDPGSLGFQTCAIAGGVLDLIGRPNLDP